MKGARVDPGLAEKARTLRSEGWALQEIADELGLSDSWVSKETKGIAPGARSRFRHLNRIDLPSVIRGFRDRGFTDSEIGHELSISASFAHYLRRKHLGPAAATAVDRDLIVDLMRRGEQSSVVADRFRVSAAFVNGLRSAAGLPAPVYCSNKPRFRRPMIGLLDYVGRRFKYDPATGEFNHNGRKVGFLRNGYICVAVKNRVVSAHRLAWLMHFREEPPAVIDHRDGDPTNNRIHNLRSATVAQNAFNKRRQCNNSTGIKGVSHSLNGRYRVRVQAGGRSVRCEVGSLDEAREARQRLADLLHGEFARHA